MNGHPTDWCYIDVEHFKLFQQPKLTTSFQETLICHFSIPQNLQIFGPNRPNSFRSYVKFFNLTVYHSSHTRIGSSYFLPNLWSILSLVKVQHTNDFVTILICQAVWAELTLNFFQIRRLWNLSVAKETKSDNQLS